MSSLKNKVVLHLTSLSSGGGGTYTIDIHRTCVDLGYDSYVVVRGRKCIYPDGSIKEIHPSRHFYWDKLRRFLFRLVIKHSYVDDAYSMYNLCERFTCHSAKDILAALPKKPDVIFVHWVSDFANAKVIRDLESMTGAKVLFIMVDHALFSGGCHYQLDCQRYKDGWHDCPATTSRWVKRGIEKNYAFKKHYLPKDIHVAARGIEKQRLSQSELFRNCQQELIVFPLDEKKFCPSSDKDALRVKWGVPVDRKVVLIGATHLNEKRKGMDLLVEALKNVHNDVLVLVAGNMDKQLAFVKEAKVLGYLSEGQLIEAYQMADLFVCPSLADAGPLMVMQSCFCGTPVVAFPVGVSAELVETGETGYLAQYGNVDDLAHGIDEIVMLPDERWKEISLKCRERVLRLCSSQAGNTIDVFLNRIFDNE